MTVAVVGAGLGGLRVCESLRQEGFSDPIVLIGEEQHQPYSRPPLSKKLLQTGDFDAVTLRSPNELAALDLDLRLGVAAVSLDTSDRCVQLADGSSVEFEHVVLATGAKPRALPGIDLDGVVTLRTLGDCMTLRSLLVEEARLVVIGAGFIGLEVAASARQLGCQVTMVDVLEHPLERVVDAAIGDAIRLLHESNDVTFRLGVEVEDIVGERRVSGVSLRDGMTLDADVVVIGIGVRPDTAWLESSGLELDDGVIADSALQAGAGIWAIGDVARWAHPSYPDGIRIEHWTNTTEQAHHVARCIVSGAPQDFDPVPYFWSDQYDAKLQSLGYASKGDETRVVAGSLDEPKWTALVRSGDRLGGVLGLRSTPRVMKGRSLLAAGASWDEALAAYT